MKKFLLLTFLSSIIAVNLCNAAMAEMKIAIVDIQAVVAKSSQVQALKKEQQAKKQDLEKWLNTAKEDVAKQQTQEGREKLLKKYNADFEKRKQELTKTYQAKVEAIDKSITASIVKEAKAKGYDLVLTKQGDVIYGGLDITSDIKKIVK